MRNEDNDCIRYLMKEMDPSEEVLMERAMMEDEDLLIEVESMRQTLKKLDKLPRKDPPSDVTDTVMAHAAEQAQKNRQSARSAASFFKYAVAATLALTVTAGGMWFYTGMNESTRSTTDTVTFASGQTAGISTTNMQQELESLENSSDPAASSSRNSVEPWVDRNNVLHFDDFFGSDDGKFQTLIRNATQKLHPIDQSAIGNDRVRSLQLTGTEQ